MGGKESKQFPITTEDALKRGKLIIYSFRKLYSKLLICVYLAANFQQSFLITSIFPMSIVTEVERRKLQDAFRRYANSSGYITRLTFLRDVLGDSIPATLAEQIYALCVAGML